MAIFFFAINQLFRINGIFFSGTFKLSTTGPFSGAIIVEFDIISYNGRVENQLFRKELVRGQFNPSTRFPEIKSDDNSDYGLHYRCFLQKLKIESPLELYNARSFYNTFKMCNIIILANRLLANSEC